MTGNHVLEYTKAVMGEGIQTDDLHHRLSPALISLGLAELYTAENFFREAAGKQLLEEPPAISSLEQTIDYDWHILRELLPLWLAARLFDIDDDTERSQIMRALYEARYAAVVPAIWQTDEPLHDDGWCCHG